MPLAELAERSVDAAVAAVLDRRLAPASARPLAVALSGGGDSLALLIAAQAWAQGRGRRLLVLTLDHRLQAASAAWTQACAATAARFGADFQGLSWEGAKPQTGLAAAARAARHRLLAQAARTAGAQVILMGHTADDVAEAAQMRRAGSTTPDPREWSPSPAWPEGRGIFLLRPLLGLRRAELRDWLAGLGESWIEDPANADPRHARARARLELAGLAAPRPDGADSAETARLALACRADAAGVISLPRTVLGAAPDWAARRFVAMACLCAAGTARPPRGDRLDGLVGALRGKAHVAATLAGARIEADAAQVRFMREAGEAARGGLGDMALPPGETVVWDGRFEITTDRPGLGVRRLAGLASRLPPSARSRLAAVPAGARGALPVLVDQTGALAGDPFDLPRGVKAAPLALARLLAACGAVPHEV